MRKFIPVSEPYITELELKYITRAVKSGWVSSLGKYITQFEENFADYCGSKYSLATSNGTTALHLALTASNIQSGDEVIVPDFTFVATANAVKYCGAKPVFVDIEPNTLCIDPDSILHAITKNTKAIIPVHIYGHPANMQAIMEIAEKYNLIVIEDCAEAHGAAIGEKKVGTFGKCGVFSFYGNKIITSGEGGMLITDDEKLYIRSKILRDHAMSSTKRYWHTEIGFNYRLTNIQAALATAQLEKIEKILKKRKTIFEKYSKRLKRNLRLKLNYTLPGYKNVFWMIRLEIEGYDEEKRNKLMDNLKQKGIDSRPYFYPVSDMPMYECADTPVTHSLYSRGINLPSYQRLTDEEIEYVCNTILKLV